MIRNVCLATGDQRSLLTILFIWGLL